MSDGGWIKMRAGLVRAPKVGAIARHLHDDARFREWLTPGGGGASSSQIVSDGALRRVTSALLMCCWSVARDCGRFDGDDLILDYSTIDDLDEMGGAPGLGRAMESVGWAVNDCGKSVRLPNFRQHNAPKSNAEKQRDYRERRRESVTCALPRESNNAVTRGEKKRREEKEEETPPTPQGGRGDPGGKASKRRAAEPEPQIPPDLDTPAFRECWADWLAYRRERRLPTTARTAKAQLAKFTKTGEAEAVAMMRQSIENGWQGLFPPKENGHGSGNGRGAPKRTTEAERGEYEYTGPEATILRL